MIFRGDTISVLLVSSGREFGSRLAAELPASEYWPVAFAGSGGEARRKLLERPFDLIVINTPLHDESGIRIAEDVSTDNGTGILMFVKNDLYDEAIARVSEKGVMVLQKPVSLQMVRQTIRLLVTVRERFKRMEEKQVTVEEKIREIRLVNRAKWLLIEKEGMTEAEAHAAIEHAAMENRITKKKAAEEVIGKYSD